MSMNFSPNPPFKDDPELSRWLAQKPLWKEKHSNAYGYFCAYCNTKRVIGLHPSPWKPRYLFRVAVTSALFMLATWPIFDWKGLVSFVPFWIAFETVYRLKFRQAVVCHVCGFDPILYVKDRNAAKELVRAKYREAYARKGIPFPEDQPISPRSSATRQSTTRSAQSQQIRRPPSTRLDRGGDQNVDL